MPPPPGRSIIYWGTQPGQEPFHLLIRPQEGVPAGKNHVANAGGGADIVDALLQRFPSHVRGLTDLPFAHAEAAIDGAAVRDEKHHPVRIAMNDAVYR